jgi:hypothetical protein
VRESILPWLHGASMERPDEGLWAFVSAVYASRPEVPEAGRKMRVPIENFSGVPGPLVRPGPDRLDLDAGDQKPLVC